MAPSIEAQTLGVRDLCHNDGKPWWRVQHLLRLNALLLIPFLTMFVSGFDGSMLNAIQTVPAWQKDFHHPSGGILGLMTSMQVIGGVVALPFAPPVADHFGRRLPVFWGSVVTILGAAIQGGAANFAMFIAGRFLIGVGGSFVATSAAPLLAELAYPTHRAVFTAIYNTSWFLGSIVAAWATYGTFKMSTSWSWRIPSLLQGAASVIQVAFIYFVPESPRWLIAKDRIEEATTILSKHHAGLDEPNELVQLEVAEITAALQHERTMQSSSYMMFFETRGNRHRLFIVLGFGIIIQLCGNQLISAYLVLVLRNIGITDAETQNLINGGLQIFCWVSATTFACFVDRLGRRKLFLTSVIGMLVVFVSWTIMAARNEATDFQNKSLGSAIVAMIFIFFLFYNMAINPLPITYLVEVLPYTLRTKGLMIFNVTQFACSIFNGFVNPVALEAISWKYYIVFDALLCLWLVVIYFGFVETKGLSLEEVAKVFDGDQVLEQTAAIKAEKYAVHDEVVSPKVVGKGSM